MNPFELLPLSILSLLGVTSGSHDQFWICSCRDDLFSSKKFIDKILLFKQLFRKLVPDRKGEMKILVKDHLPAKFIGEEWTDSLYAIL